MTVARTLAVVVALACWVPSTASAQEKKDPQSAFEPRSKPGIGQKFLARFVGDWDVVKTFYPKTGEPFRVTGECKQTMIHGGRFLQSEFVFRQGDAKTTGLGIIGFDADAGVFSSVWTDSRSTKMSLRQSKDPFDGDEIVLFGQNSKPDAKSMRVSRTVTRLENEDRKLVHRQYTAGGDGKERVIMELILTRKAPATPSGK